MKQVVLKIEGVECRYYSSRVLKNITFEASGGDFIGLIGPNGSGKTTLLRSISRILEPHVGTVLLDGKNVYSLPIKEVAKRVAVVPQEQAQFPFTVLEIVMLGRTPHLKWFETEGDKDFEIARDAMKITNTLHLADRLFTELSGGEKQRVIIAQALAQEPKVLLLDEPTVHLDISNQVEILDLLKKMSREKELVIIAVFHDLNLAAQYCDYLILLNHGEIKSMGSPKAVLTPENIREVYRMEVLVRSNPITNSPQLILLSHTDQRIQKHTPKFTVHLICGAGTGSSLMENLLSRGFNVTAGILSTLDTDYELATHFDIPVVSDPPFSPASEQAYETTLKFIERADVVVLTEIPIGWGNMKNLEAAERALKMGKLLIMIGTTPFEERDFTGGEARKRLAALIQEGAICVKNSEEALAEIIKLKDNG